MVERLKLAVSHIAWEPKQEEEALALLREFSFEGVEIVPPRLAGAQPYESPGKAKAYAEWAKSSYGLSLCSMQSIWFGQTGNLFGGEREALLAYSKQAIRFAAAAGIPNLVFGCPKNRVLPKGVLAEQAVSFFKELGEEAKRQGTCFSLEANPAIYETNFMNRTLEAFEMAKRSATCKVNLDVGTMVENGESIASLTGRVPEIQHVHVSEPWLKAIEPRALHRELAQLLKAENYKGFVSVEMKSQPLSVLKETLSYVREAFA